MILQLNPSIPLTTPKGAAYAHFLIDYGEDHHLVWGCLVKETGEWWWLANPEVRGEKNVTMGVKEEASNTCSSCGKSLIKARLIGQNVFICVNPACAHRVLDPFSSLEVVK